MQRTRQRFVEGNLEGALNERPRLGGSKKLDEKEEAILETLAQSKPPEGRKRWTLELLADRLVDLKVVDDISYETVRRAFEPAEAKRILDRLDFHYTPKHGSWLNMVEIEIGVLCEQCPDDRIPDEQTLRCEIAAWETARNAQQATIDWQFTSINARTKLKRLYPILSESL